MSHENAPILISPKRTIALVGLMGVGKTSIGKRLAVRLGISFVDADQEIESAAGMTIPEIFERFGEGEFRDGERRVIARLVEGKPRVLATGGGAFMNDSTRALLLKRTITVWLNADIETLADRVARKDNRPLLAGKDAKVVLRELAAIRNPVYAQADVHVKSQSAPHESTVEEIVSAIRERVSE